MSWQSLGIDACAVLYDYINYSFQYAGKAALRQGQEITYSTVEYKHK